MLWNIHRMRSKDFATFPSSHADDERPSPRVKDKANPEEIGCIVEDLNGRRKKQRQSNSGGTL